MNAYEMQAKRYRQNLQKIVEDLGKSKHDSQKLEEDLKKAEKV